MTIERCNERRAQCLLAGPPDPPHDEGRQRKGEVFVGERCTPEQKHRIGGVDQAGPGGGAAGTRHFLGDKEHTRRDEHPGHADDDQPGREDTESGEVHQAGGERAQPRVVGGGRKEWIDREEVLGAENVLSAPHMDVLVDVGEGTGRAEDLHAVERGPEQQDQRQPLASMGALHQHPAGDRYEDQEKAEPEEDRRIHAPIAAPAGHIGEIDRGEAQRGTQNDEGHPREVETGTLIQTGNRGRFRPGGEPRSRDGRARGTPGPGRLSGRRWEPVTPP